MAVEKIEYETVNLDVATEEKSNEQRELRLRETVALVAEGIRNAGVVLELAVAEIGACCFSELTVSATWYPDPGEFGEDRQTEVLHRRSQGNRWIRHPHMQTDAWMMSPADVLILPNSLSLGDPPSRQLLEPLWCKFRRSR